MLSLYKQLAHLCIGTVPFRGARGWRGFGRSASAPLSLHKGGEGLCGPTDAGGSRDSHLGTLPHSRFPAVTVLPTVSF